MDSSKDTSAPHSEALSPEEVRLLVYAACCVIAADGTIAQRERDALLAAMNRIGIPHDPKAMNAHVVAVCKQIHKEGVSACAAEAARQVAGASSSLKTALSSLTAELQWADGTATVAEVVVGTVLQSAINPSTGWSVVKNPDGFELGPLGHDDAAGESGVANNSRPISTKHTSTLGLAAPIIAVLLFFVIIPAWVTVTTLSKPQDGRRRAESAHSGVQDIATPVEIAPSGPSAESDMLAAVHDQDTSLKQHDSQSAGEPLHDNATVSAESVDSVREELRQARAEVAELKKTLDSQKTRAADNRRQNLPHLTQQPANRVMPQLDTPTDKQGKPDVGQASNEASDPSGMSRKDFLARIRLTNSIRRGMTKEEVRDIIGMPQEWPVDLSTPGGGLGLCAFWDRKTTNPATHAVDEMVLISFGDYGKNAEKVVFVESQDVFFNSVMTSGKTTDTAYSLLGPPDEIGDAAVGIELRRSRTWTYRYRVAARKKYPRPNIEPCDAVLYFDEKDRLENVWFSASDDP